MPTQTQAALRALQRLTESQFSSQFVEPLMRDLVRVFIANLNPSPAAAVRAMAVNS